MGASGRACCHPGLSPRTGRGNPGVLGGRPHQCSAVVPPPRLGWPSPRPRIAGCTRRYRLHQRVHPGDGGGGADAACERAELVHLNQVLADRAVRDPLTRLYNHSYLWSELESLVRACAEGDEGGALVMMDIDRFKEWNDTFGHWAGDEVLCAVADAIRTESGANSVACRYGGDEFALLLPGAGREDALRIAERIRARVAAIEPTRILGRAQEVTRALDCSYGVSLFPNDACTASAIVEAADRAMYRHKGDRGHAGGGAPTVRA